MQELFDLFYLYDYTVQHTEDEEARQAVILREYVKSLIRSMGEE